MRLLFVVVLIVAAIAAYAAFQYHFILIDDGVRVLKKTKPTLDYTFVDGRGVINQAKILTNPTLVQAGIQNVLSGDGATIRPKKQIEDKLDKIAD